MSCSLVLRALPTKQFCNHLIHDEEFFAVLKTLAALQAPCNLLVAYNLTNAAVREHRARWAATT